MRSTSLVLLVTGTVIVAGVTWLLWPEPGPTIPPQQQSFPGLGAGELQGVVSCSAAACHGNGRPGSPGGECTTWSASDPHARAYAVLLEARSKAIEHNLNRGQAEPRPEQNELCLNCHVQPGVLRANRSPRFALSDGVGCESCHGPAGKWRHKHTRTGWSELADWPELADEKRRELGMTATGNLQVRAEVCATCHVGREESEVNHDLIAAGHPRLRFEFGAYLANYPAHWRKCKDQKRYPDLDARAWAVGQVVSAEAALRLLAHRASSPKAIWPELAEHDCYGCHHDLTPRNWRQQTLTPGIRPGSMGMNDWYYAALPALDRLAQPADKLDLASLGRLMSRPKPNRDEVSRQARKLADQLAQRTANLAGKELGERAMHSLLVGLVEESRQGRPSWDRDTQLFLGASALVQAGRSAPPGFRRALTELGMVLNRAFLAGPDKALDSPRNYDPDEVRKRWAAIRKQLEEMGAR